MAQRRMFSLKVIDTDLFLEMPASSQLLYFHLSMRADDDGFIGSPNKIRKMVNCSEDDLKLLTAKQFIIPFESGICVIKHWRIHNYIQNDRYNPTMYLQEKASLSESNGIYNEQNILEAKCIHDVSNMETQVRLGKDRLGKDIVECERIDAEYLQKIIDSWNNLGLQKLIGIKSGSNRYKALSARIIEFGIDKVIDTVTSISKSNFLKGQNDKGWTITFDWLIKPNNFIKVAEGNYIEKKPVVSQRNKSKFHNFTPREYDYDELERKLLGWDKDDDEEES